MTDLDPMFVKALRLLHSKSKDSADQLKQLLDDVLHAKKGQKVIKLNRINPQYESIYNTFTYSTVKLKYSKHRHSKFMAIAKLNRFPWQILYMLNIKIIGLLQTWI